MSITTPRLSRALVPFLALGLTALIPAATAAAAPTPDEVVERCVNHLEHATQRTVEAIRAAAADGVQKIETLDANDKPPRVMIKAAKRASAKIEKRDRKGARVINKGADKCLRILAHIEAGPAFGLLVDGARARALEAIHTAAGNAHDRVRAALEAALEDEETPTDAGGGVAPLDPTSPR